MQMVTPLSSAMDFTRFNPAIVLRAPSIAGEGDHVGHIRLRGKWDVFAECGFDGGMVLRAVHRLLDLAAAGVAHGAAQAILRGDGILIHFEEIDAYEAERFCVGAEFRQGPFGIAPAADGLMDPAIYSCGCVLLFCLLAHRRAGKRRAYCRTDGCLQNISPVPHPHAFTLVRDVSANGAMAEAEVYSSP
jgi:hypothetical protein